MANRLMEAIRSALGLREAPPEVPPEHHRVRHRLDEQQRRLKALDEMVEVNVAADRRIQKLRIGPHRRRATDR